MSAVDKALDTAGKTASRFQAGCWIVFANLFLGGFCLWGMYAAYIGWQLETKGEKTTGIVTGLEESDSSEGGCCVYSPVVEFHVDGQTYTFESGNASDPPAYRVGQEVRVLYDPQKPETAQIDSFFERWLFPIIIIPAMSITALVLNFFLLRAFWRGESVGE